MINLFKLRFGEFSFLCIMFLSISLAEKVNDPNPIVEVSNGKVRGETMETPSNKTFYAFRGIPFARPPTGDLRFEPPQEPENWKGVLGNQNAYKMCIQLSTHTFVNETEDCLYLHVYTPQLPSKGFNESLPVLVFIHGGAFVLGSADIEYYGPQYIMDYDIVLVEIQYRLSLFGFLSTGDLVCPGNNGLKDQRFALKWVQKNIIHFSGNPNLVTIFGQSAGSASIGYQLLGQNADGLFRGAIQDSGSPLGAWALQQNSRHIADKLIQKIDPSIDVSSLTSEELLSFYKNISVSQYKEAAAALFGQGLIGGFFTTFSGFVFSGVIEPEHDGAFLTKSAYEKFTLGNFTRVPLLIGITSEEALFLEGDEKLAERMRDYDMEPERLVSPDMHIVDENTKRFVGNEIRRSYVGNDTFTHHMGLFIKYFSDGAFGRPVLKQAELASNYTNVYLYEFGYKGILGEEGENFTNIPEAESISHGGELGYIFHNKLASDLSTYPEHDIITMQRMLIMWTNFVKYLNPTPVPLDVLQNITWPKLMSNGEKLYMLINETLQIRADLKYSMVEEFRKLYESYAVYPLDTY